MKALVLALSLALPAAAEGPDAATRVKIAEYMLKTPMNEADPTLVSGFMKLDPESLPKKLRDKVRGKQMEIDAVVKIHNGKKKGPFRFPAACAPKYYDGPEGIRIMNYIIGNREILPEEEEYLELKGNCSEAELMCEFSLNVVRMKPEEKGKRPYKRYFLMEQDPLMAWVAEKRGGGASAGNRYFQELKPSCQKNASQ